MKKKYIFLLMAVLFSVQLIAQTTKLTGTVKDTKGEAIIGATVAVKGTTNGSQTNLEGNFELTNVPAGSTLLVSYIGYTNKEVVVGNQSVINVELSESTQQLSEVVVVGYGTKKRSDITGSVTSISRERLSQLPVTNALQAVQGAAAGINITQSSSVPGSSTTALVRGVNSISASTGPLLVVDGVPFTNGGSINDINPADIAAIEILKDASSVAIYGTRGANGVILITTKRGKSGKATISFNTYAGVEGFAHTVESMDAETYVKKFADWKTQNGSTSTAVLPNAYEIANYNAGTTQNWLDLVKKQGNISNYNLNISGGSEDVKYYVSADWLKQNGVVKGYQYNRGSVRANIDAKLTPFLNAGVNLFLTANNSDGGRASMVNASSMSPYGTAYAANGNYEIYPMFGELLYVNPLLGLTTTRQEQSKNINTNFFAVLSPAFLEGFKYRLNASYSYVPTVYRNYVGRLANDMNGTATLNNSETKTWLLENIFTYENKWNDHSLDLTGLLSAQKTDFSRNGLTAIGFINDNLTFNNLSSAASTSPTSNAFETQLLSQMLRVNYGYKSKYLVTATARRDGYSAFGSNTSKYGLFPSMALAWNISKESFFQSVKFVDNLKLRVSYGLSGNQAIDANSTISTSSSVRMPYNGLSTIGVVANVLGNNNLTWESTYGTNAGIDFSLLEGKVSGTIEGYATKTNDLLLYRSLPTITGYTRVLDNLGKVANKGIEVSIKTNVIGTKTFRWDVSANFAANKNKILDLYGDGKDDVGNRWFIGKPVNVLYDYKFAGIWQAGEDVSSQDPTAKPGFIKFADLNGSKTITPDDRMIVGQTTPKWTGGLTNTFNYKNWNLNIFIQTVQGVTKNNSLLDFRDLAGRQNLPAAVDYWTAENKSNERPSLAYINSRLYNYPTDASYTRLKDVTLSHVFAEKTLKKLGLGGLTMYISGRNLLTFTKWIGWDPEVDYSRDLATPAASVAPSSSNTVGNNGNPTQTSSNNYPLVRTFIIGLNLNLK